MAKQIELRRPKIGARGVRSKGTSVGQVLRDSALAFGLMFSAALVGIMVFMLLAMAYVLLMSLIVS